MSVTVNNIDIVTGDFPNEERIYLIREPSMLCSYVFRVNFQNNADIFDMLLYKKYIDDTCPNADTALIMDFMPYGQSDRAFKDKIFTFKYFAKLINDAKFDQVYIMDPHSPVMEAAIDRCNVSYPLLPDDYDLYFYPDNGAAKKYSEIYDHPYRFGNKKRDLDTGKIICYEVIADKKDIEGKKILIKDDLCMGGRTFMEAAKALHDMGAAQIDLHITHLMPQSKDFFEHHKDFYIDNFYSNNTLQLDFFSNPF